MRSSLVDSRSKVAEKGGDVLSPLMVALDDILHLQSESFSPHNGIIKTSEKSIATFKPQQWNETEERLEGIHWAQSINI